MSGLYRRHQCGICGADPLTASCCTERIAELEAKIAHCRALIAAWKPLVGYGFKVDHDAVVRAIEVALAAGPIRGNPESSAGRTPGVPITRTDADPSGQK